MKIGIDLRPLQGSTEYRGIGYTIKGLVRALLREHPQHEYLFYIYKNMVCPPWVLELVPSSKLREASSFSRHYLVNNLHFHFFDRRAMVKENLDIFLNTDPEKGIPKGKFKTICLFYDLIPLFFPRQYFAYSKPFFSFNLPYLRKNLRAFAAKRYYRFSVKQSLKADKILAISSQTKRDLIQIFRCPREKVEVMYLGIDPRYKVIKNQDYKNWSGVEKYGLKPPFILYVGGTDLRKNLTSLMKAFSHLKKKSNFPHRLVIVGKDAKDTTLAETRRLHALIDDCNLSSEVLLTDYVSIDDLVWFYNLADLFAFPSLYEGFGLPVLEAMACGCPVICSNSSSFPEVAGDAAVLIDPTDTMALVRKIKQVITDQELRLELRERGLLQVKKFSLEKAADKFIQTAQELLR